MCQLYTQYMWVAVHRKMAESIYVRCCVIKHPRYNHRSREHRRRDDCTCPMRWEWAPIRTQMSGIISRERALGPLTDLGFNNGGRPCRTRWHMIYTRGYRCHSRIVVTYLRVKKCDTTQPRLANHKRRLTVACYGRHRGWYQAFHPWFRALHHSNRSPVYIYGGRAWSWIRDQHSWSRSEHQI
jgi:hypothetical protein